MSFVVVDWLIDCWVFSPLWHYSIRKVCFNAFTLSFHLLVVWHPHNLFPRRTHCESTATRSVHAGRISGTVQWLCPNPRLEPQRRGSWLWIQRVMWINQSTDMTNWKKKVMWINQSMDMTNWKKKVMWINQSMNMTNWKKKVMWINQSMNMTNWNGF